MHHKRKKPKNARSGCLMCKPHKMNGAKCTHFETANARQEYVAKDEIKRFMGVPLS